MYALAHDIQPVYYRNIDYTIEKALFFSNYVDARWFLSFCNKSKHYDIPLINRNYYFLDVQPALEKSFSKVIDEEEYIDVIRHTVYLLCDNVEMCLESFDAGNKPVFFMKKNNKVKNIQALYEKGIPVIKARNLDELMKNYDRSIQNYDHAIFNTQYI